MTNWVRSCIFVAVAIVTASGAVRHKPASIKKPATKRTQAHTSSSRSKVASKTSGRRTYASRKASSRRRTSVASYQPARQAAPSSDRFREIQEALAKKGYLNTPPTGAWDQNSQDAMRKFQADQNLSVSGKLSSRSLIALGLGSPTAAVPPSTVPEILIKP